MKYAFNRQKMLTLILIVVCCLVGTAVAEEESYYLEQMRKQSQSKSNTPEQVLPDQDSSLIADTDIQALSEASDNLSLIDNMKPEFEKPKLDTFKPDF